MHDENRPIVILCLAGLLIAMVGIIGGCLMHYIFGGN